MEIGGLVRASSAGVSADQYWKNSRLLDSDLAPPRMLTANLRAAIRFLASQPQATKHKYLVCRSARGQLLVRLWSMIRSKSWISDNCWSHEPIKDPSRNDCSERNKKKCSSQPGISA
jgi:hypothetical protein